MTSEEKIKLKEAETMDPPLTYSETHVRQLDLLPEACLDQSIAIIGIGGIGSPTAYLLAKMGFKNITIIDPDTVELHNVSTQMYGLEDVGHTKVGALSKNIKRDIGTSVLSTYGKSTLYHGSDIVISCLDSMDERIKLWNKTMEITEDIPRWFIDGRMGLEFVRLYAFSPYDSKSTLAYEKQLYPSSEALALPCTARAVAYNTFFIASIIASIVVKIVKGEDVPFETMGDIGKLGIKTFKA